MKKLLFIVIMIVCAGCSAQSIDPEATVDKTSELQILFINVGKADGALVSYGEKHYLIDTGSYESSDNLEKVLISMGVDKLDGIFLSHTHNDHIGGLSGLLDNFNIETIYASNISVNKKDGSNVVDEIVQSAGMSVDRLEAGDEVIIDVEHPEVKFTVLGPRTYSQDDNDNSLVLLLEYGQYSSLFTGDMQFDEEESLLDAGVIRQCTILKVGNHGNPDASSQEFIQAVSPKYAVISTDSSVDKDTPADRVIDELESVGAQVYMTEAVDGGVLIKIGHTIETGYASFGVEQSPQGLFVESLDKEAELLVLGNDGAQGVYLNPRGLFFVNLKPATLRINPCSETTCKEN